MKRGRVRSECRIADLPEEILIDILSRLLVKTIVSCRCVCKTWRNLLSSSNTHFTKLHFNRSPQQWILQTRGSSNAFYLVEIEYDTDVDNDIKPLPSRFRFSRCTLIVVNSCNGFICLATHRNSFNPVKVCNPITGEYLNLPTNKMDDCVESHVVSGFGCSAKTNQYKVVRLVQREGEFKGRMVEVYTIGTKSWRTIGTAPKFSDGLCYTTFFNGTIHWLCDDELCSDYIVTFDLESEKFGIVPPPPHFSTEMDRYGIAIVVLGEFLSLLHKKELWVMKEYGVQESWTKVCDIDCPVDSHYLSIRLISDDPMEKICKEFKVPLSVRVFETFAHVPSLMTFNDAMGDKGAKLRTRMCRVRIEGRD